MDSFTKVSKDKQALEAFLAQPALSLVVMRARDYDALKDRLAGRAFLVTKDQIGRRPMVLIANRKRQPRRGS